jgi:hypothetical protein
MPEKAIHEIPVRMHWYPPRFEPGAEPHRFAYEKEAPLSNEYYRRELTPSGIKAPHVSDTAGHTHTDKTEEKKMAGDSHGHKDGGGFVEKGGIILACLIATIVLVFAIRGGSNTETRYVPLTSHVAVTAPVAPVAPAVRPPIIRQSSIPGPHRRIRVCVPCDAGYRQDPNTCDCTRTTWHPGPPPAPFSRQVRQASYY